MTKEEHRQYLEFAQGGNIIQGIGQGLQVAGSLAGNIPGIGTAIGAGLGGLGAGLENVGTGADFKEVMTDVAFGAGKGATGTMGSMAIGAAEQMYDANTTSASDQKDLWASKYDPNYANDQAQLQKQQGLIQGAGQVAGMFMANGGKVPKEDLYTITDNPSRDGDTMDYYRTKFDETHYPEGIKQRITKDEYLQYTQNTKALGGEIPNYGCGGNVYSDGGPVQPQYEAEGGEIVEGDRAIAHDGGELANNSSTAQKINGQSHNQGGVKMSGGERIYSDRLSISDSFLKELDI